MAKLNGALKRCLLISVLALGGSILVTTAPACAQSISSRAKENVGWFSSPREIQIIDDRPVVHEFRESPVAEPTVDLSQFAVASQPDNDRPIGTIPSGGLSLAKLNSPRVRAASNQGGVARAGLACYSNVAASSLVSYRDVAPDGTTTNRMMIDPATIAHIALNNQPQGNHLYPGSTHSAPATHGILLRLRHND